MDLPLEAKNWKTVKTPFLLDKCEEKPILKKDSHRAEIINILTGEVIDEKIILYEEFNEPLYHNDVGDSFCKVDVDEIY